MAVANRKSVAGKKRNPRPTAADMLETVKLVAAEKGGKCLSKRYQQSPAKLRFQCAHGHRWSSTASNVLHAGRWCPQCHKSAPQDAIDAFYARLEELGGSLVRKTLGVFTSPHRFRCAKGHLFSQVPAHLVRRGYWCARCAYEEKGLRMRVGLELVQEIASDRGGWCLAKEYTNAAEKVRWRCAAGHEWDARITSVIHEGKWCRECWLESRRQWPGITAEPRDLSIEDCWAIADYYGGRCLSDEYVNYLEPLEWQCERKHEFEASLHNMEARYNYCLECAEIERREEWLETARAYAISQGGQCLSNEWHGNKIKLSWQCKRKHYFDKCWDIVTKPPFCGQCAIDDRFKSEGAARLDRLAAEFGGKWVHSEYKGQRAAYDFRCSKGHRFRANPRTARRSWGKLCDCKSQ